MVEGNDMMTFSAGILNLCLRHRVSAGMENPRSSWIWKAPPLEDLMKKVGVDTVTVDMCAFKATWRKRTRVLTVWFPIESPPPLCRSSGGKCSFTGQPHVERRGKLNGAFWTMAAQMYPRKFCNMIVKVVLRLWQVREGMQLHSLFLGGVALNG